MFEDIHALRKRSNEFVKNIDKHETTAIKMSEDDLIRLNHKQLQASTLADGKPITPLYSPAYAKKKGYDKPDLFDTGKMYRLMEVSTKSKSWSIDSLAEYTKYLKSYGKIFGIAPKNRPKATESAVKSFRKLWIMLVTK